MPTIFVTGTGTDIGKTFVACGLIRSLRARGYAVSALKPIVSGFDPDRPSGSDPAHLLEALGEPVTAETLARLSPWRYRAPLSPDMAAAAEDRRVPFEAVDAHCREAMPDDETILLVEGVGGVMTPLDADHTVLNLAMRLGVPVVLVGGSYLGALSHVLTAQAVLDHRALDLAAIVISESEGSTVPLEATLETLARFANAPVLGIPRSDDDAKVDEAFARLEALISAQLGTDMP
jgi:dethiobiotin synthetase